MATEIWLTDGVTRVTAQGAVQALYQAVDVSKYDQADLLLWVHGVEGTATNFVVSIITGMSTDSEEGWWTVNSFSNITAANATSFEKKNFPQLLKYLRWKVTGFTGPTAVSFSIRGMLRNN